MAHPMTSLSRVIQSGIYMRKQVICPASAYEARGVQVLESCRHAHPTASALTCQAILPEVETLQGRQLPELPRYRAWADHEHVRLESFTRLRLVAGIVLVGRLSKT